MHTRQAQDMAAYNRWMNQRLYAVCAELSDAQRREDCGVFFKSIHGTLNHLLLADRIWLGRFFEEPVHVDSLNQELYADFLQLRQAREQADETIVQWVATLTDDDLAGTLRYASIVNPATRSYEMGLAVTHFFNHQTHHRGQLTALLSQYGKDYGTTDIIWLPEVLARNGN